ncbi:DUF2336 domain-containing protein [Sphingomonas jatrophae]|uniref:DUF2336 domain-containing protein n=1 Tax=Sphingomonas jatrophae TaxID=1166337 RepID=A0A1I6JW92_9SPHN|nr:DUF2336 domain-containing protein [Sphingomonas jatrophae]SFR82820.1 hypothetical protein SAMN05192580_0924 [Sphingomonas jatrophae]
MAVPFRDLPSAAARLLADAAAAGVAARQRVQAAVADIALPGPARLSDYQRAAVSRMAEGILLDLEGALARGIAERLGEHAPPVLVERETPIALPVLERAGLPHDVELVALLLRRATEHRLGRRLRRTGGPGPLEAILGDADVEIARAAAAVLTAEARRYDGFHDAALPLVDLPGELLHRLVWSVAAALRIELVQRDDLPAAAVDRAAAAAAQALLAGHDEAAGFDGRALALVRTLDRAGRLEDDAVADFAEGGQVAVTVAALAHRAALDPAGAWEMALDPAGSRLAVLLRAAGLGGEGAGRILAAWLVHPRDIGEIGEDLASLSEADAREATRLWRLDPAFRAAIQALA